MVDLRESYSLDNRRTGPTHIQQRFPAQAGRWLSLWTSDFYCGGRGGVEAIAIELGDLSPEKADA